MYTRQERQTERAATQWGSQRLTPTGGAPMRSLTPDGERLQQKAQQPSTILHVWFLLVFVCAVLAHAAEARALHALRPVTLRAGEDEGVDA